MDEVNHVARENLLTFLTKIPEAGSLTRSGCEFRLGVRVSSAQYNLYVALVKQREIYPSP